MLSNTCEDKHFSNDVTEYHEKLLGKMGIPKWASVKCCFCGKDMPLRSIRSIALNFNARNVGDVSIEFLCPSCSKMDTVFFRGAAHDVGEFVALLKDDKSPVTSPIIEEEMYRSSYNNTIEKMAGEGKV